MSTKIKIFVTAVFLSGLLLSPAAGFARDQRHWANEHRHREGQEHSRDRFRVRQQARRQLDYDLSHHASRKRLAQDDARIRNFQRDGRWHR